MIYEWRCNGCSMVVEVTRPAKDYNRMPGQCNCGEKTWSKKLSTPHTPFEHLRDKGVFERLERFPMEG